LEPAQAGALAPGDYAYLLAPALKARRLDSIFAPRTEKRLQDMLEGEFAIRGDAPVERIETFYGLGTSAEDRKFTVAELFADRFERAPDIGDSLPLGRARLVVRELDGDEVLQASLQFIPVEEVTPAARLRGIFARVRRRANNSPPRA
jgi:NhaP-type Na+/H+ and K+/H+ antiporter